MERTFRGITYTVETAPLNDQFLKGTPSPDWIEALGGNYTIVTGASNDVVLAGVDFDFIDIYEPYGGEAVFFSVRSDGGNNVINVGTGDDYVVAGQGNDVVYLGQGNDIFDGAFGSEPGGNDIIYAGAGNDIIYAWSSGSKTIYAGLGNDRISVVDYSSSGDEHTIDAGVGNDIISLFTGGDNAVVYAGVGNDRIDMSVDDGSGILYSGTGDDDISVFINDGFVDAGQGNDNIFSGGSSVINAKAGDDLIGLALSDGPAKAGSGNDTIFTPTLFDVVSDYSIYGESGNDTVISGPGNDTIYGGSGDDLINLRGSNVSVPEFLVDIFGPEIVVEGEIIVEGGGNDTIYLDRGKDTVILGSGGFATIYGFSRNDRLDVSGLNASFTQTENDTLISSDGNSLGVLKGYTGSVDLA